MAILFQTGFETGDLTEFTGMDADDQTTILVDTLEPYEGTCHLKINGGPHRWGAELWKDLPGNERVSLEFMIKIKSLTLPVGKFLVLANVTPPWLASQIAYGQVGLVNDGGVIKWYFQWRGMGYDDAIWLSEPSPTIGVYHKIKIEVYSHVSEGEAALFINDVEVHRETGLSNIEAGLPGSYIFCVWVASDEYVVFADVYYDSVTVESIEPVQRTVSYTSTPISVNATIDTTIIPSGGSIQVVDGTSITYEAPVVDGYVFDHWERRMPPSASPESSKVNPDSVVVTDDVSLLAVYTAIIQRTVSYSSTPIEINARINGVLTPSGASIQVEDGSTVTYEAFATLEGYRFDHWERRMPPTAPPESSTVNPDSVVATDDIALLAVYVLLAGGMTVDIAGVESTTEVTVTARSV